MFRPKIIAEIYAYSGHRGSKAGATSYKFDVLKVGNGEVFMHLDRQDHARTQSRLNASVRAWETAHRVKLQVIDGFHPESGLPGFYIRMIDGNAPSRP